MNGLVQLLLLLVVLYLLYQWWSGTPTPKRREGYYAVPGAGASSCQQCSGMGCANRAPTARVYEPRDVPPPHLSSLAHTPRPAEKQTWLGASPLPAQHAVMPYDQFASS